MKLYAHDLHVESPCTERWEAMAPAKGGRSCAKCDHVVLDASALTASALRHRLARGSACIRYEVRDDGSVITAPLVAPSRLLAKVRPLLVAASTVLLPACAEEARLASPPVETTPAAPPVGATPTSSVAPVPVPEAQKPEAVAAACDALADAGAAESAADAGAQRGGRRPRRVIMGRYLPRGSSLEDNPY